MITIKHEWYAIADHWIYPVSESELYLGETPQKASRFTVLSIFGILIPIGCDKPILWSEYVLTRGQQ